LVGAAVAGAVLSACAWRLSGGREYTIVTASMCPDLCVGTLVLDRPLVGPARPGMIVTFRPPGTTTVYTHRVVKVLPDGSLKTAGDALGVVDPWTVPRERVIGRVVAHLRGVGWLWRSLPEMTAALACYLMSRRAVRCWLRPHTDVLFVAVLVAVPTFTLRPLLRASVIAIGRHGPEAVLRVANTGLLPAQLSLGGPLGPGHVAPGQIATVASTAASRLWLHWTVSFAPWQWALVALILALPVLALAVRAVALRRSSEPPVPDGVPAPLHYRDAR
jgi:hypothetical protein